MPEIYLLVEQIKILGELVVRNSIGKIINILMLQHLKLTSMLHQAFDVIEVDYNYFFFVKIASAKYQT